MRVFMLILLVQENLLILDCPPQTLNHDVIKSPAFTVHANPYAGSACVLASLILVEYLRCTGLQRPVQAAED